MNSEESGKLDPVKGVFFYLMLFLLVMEIFFPTQLTGFIIRIVHLHSQAPTTGSSLTGPLRITAVILTIVAIVRILRS